MKRTLVVVAAVVGFAAAASAGTLTVFTTTAGNVPSNVFSVGDTILLKVTGNGNGQVGEASILGTLTWNAALTTTVISPALCNGSPTAPCTSMDQGSWLQDEGGMAPGDGIVSMFDQAGLVLNNSADSTSFVTLIADAAGTTEVRFGGPLLDFFGIYSYDSQNPVDLPTGHSFTINPVVPEPTTAGLVGLGLIGLVLGGRRRA